MASSTKSLKKRPRPATDPIRQRVSDFMGEIYRERIRSGRKTSTQPSLEARSITVQKTKQKSSPLRLPKQIKIQREKGYHTHHIGKCKDGTQFMAFIVATNLARGARALRWYAVVHHFDSSGKHLGTDASFLGSKAFAKDLDHPDAKLTRMIRKLGSISYCDITVQLFSVEIDGNTFGLVSASIPTKRYQRIDLVPNGLAFFPPWDGTYDT
jgi:hypothetical protein